MKNKIYIFSAIIVLIGLIAVPTQCMEAAGRGLNLCQTVIIPSLFPFFVCSKLLIQLGFVAILGKKCGFIMRPLFNVPGNGAFAFCVGILSGYPVGAKAVSELYEQSLCTKSEAERLLALCNNSGPLFIIGAVGTGMYHSPQIGILLYAAHILSAITIGLLFRFYKRKDIPSEKRNSNASIIIASNFGEVMGNAIKDSILSTVMVCGYILFFSVLLAIMQAFHLFSLLSGLFLSLGIAPESVQGLSFGIIELTNGIQKLAPNLGALPLVSFLLAWSGISVIMQVSGIVGRYKLSMKVFFIAKLLQGLFALVYTYILTLFITIPTFADITKSPPNIIVESSWLYSFIYILIAIIIFTFTAIIGYRLSTQKA